MHLMRMHGKKAVSEIIGTLLVVLATISVGVVLVTVSSSSLASNILNQSNQVSLQTQHIQERLTLYDVWYHKAANGTRLLNIHVYDYGQVVIHLVTLYTNITGSEVALANFSSTYSNGVYVSPTSQSSLTVAFGYIAGKNYNLILVSDTGTTFQSIWGA